MSEKKKKCKQNLLHCSYSFGNTWKPRIFGGQNSVGVLSFWFKIINPGPITSNYFVKNLFAVCAEVFLPLLHGSSFVHLLINEISILQLFF